MKLSITKTRDHVGVVTSRNRPRTVIRLVLTSTMVLALVLTPVWSGRRISAQSLSCGIREITFTSDGGNFFSSISGDGTHIAFESNADGNHEIFLYNTQTASFTQITDTPERNSGDPSISNDGMRIAFLSSYDLSGANPDFNEEVFLYDATTDSITQVTNTIAEGGSGFVGSNKRPSISGDGTRIAFVSSLDPNGGDESFVGINEIFLYFTQSNTLYQITGNYTGQISSDLSISDDGTRIAYRFTGDPTGGNPDGNSEIFLYDTQTGSNTQVTFTTTQPNENPSISGDGRRIAFLSRGFPAGNPDGDTEIFLYDATTGGIAQITNTSFGGDFRSLSISDDGTRIAFESRGNHTGGNADGNREIFLYDTITSSFTQVTDTTEDLGTYSQFPSINGDGTRIAFESNGYQNIGNADGNPEIFLATCLSPQPPASADLLVSLAADKTSVKQGDRLTYTLTVQNFGPSTAAGVVVNDMLSSGSTFVSASANRGNFTAPPAGQTGTVTWNVGNMLIGDQEAAQIQVTVIVRGRTTITNTATVGSAIADPNAANNSASITTTVVPGGKK